MSDTTITLPLAIWERAGSPRASGAEGGEVFTLARATEADAATLVALYDEAGAWLLARGLRQWPPGWFTPDMVANDIRAGHEIYLVRRAGESGESGEPGEPVGKLALQWADPEMWGERSPDAGYVHGLCVSRAAAGLGLGAVLLDWAGARVAARGRAWLRLDCMAANPALRAYYERQGFVYRGEAEDGWAALYERRASAEQAGG